MKRLETITPLTRRVIVFIVLFVILSGLSGPRIISGRLLFNDGFAIYGSLGKATIFGLIAFVLLARRNGAETALHPWRWVLLGWILAAGAAFGLAWIGIGNLIAGGQNFQNLVLAHGGLLLSLVLAALGCLGPKNISLTWRRYRREIAGSAALAAGFYIFLIAVYALWQPLAATVLRSVDGLLNLSGLHANIVPPYTVVLDKFGITIAQYCSGIESIVLFTCLYALVGLLDWPRLLKRRYFLMFPFALFILFSLNVMRVYFLIMAGYYINPAIAFSLFHTYAGMVFFILYSLVFWSVAYRHLLKPKKREE